MFRYRPTAVLLPGLLLLLIAMLAAYPWRMPFGNGFALPLVGMMTVFFSVLRYPGLILSPFAFLAGLACDLFTRAPLGFWALLFTLTAAFASAARDRADESGAWLGWLSLLLIAPLSAALVWGLSSLYQWQMQPLRPIADSLAMALLLLPIPLILLLGLEPALTIHRERHR